MWTLRVTTGGLPGPADASLSQPALLESNRGGTAKAKMHVAREPKFILGAACTPEKL